MSPLDGEEEPLESPCVGVCQVDGEDVCLGCGRTIDEIASWSQLDHADQKRVVERARERMQGRTPS